MQHAARLTVCTFTAMALAGSLLIPNSAAASTLMLPAALASGPVLDEIHVSLPESLQSDAGDSANAMIQVLSDGTRAMVENLPSGVTDALSNAAEAAAKAAPQIVKVAGIAVAKTGGDETPRIVRAKKSLQCVPFARALSGIDIYGDARSWWRKARGLYAKLTTPKTGAVMVFASTRRIRLGHVAVVKEVISNREVKVDHANWGNDGKIYLNAPVVDVSKNNDWSRVRVWNTKIGALGSHVYRLKGFLVD